MNDVLINELMQDTRYQIRDFRVPLQPLFAAFVLLPATDVLIAVVGFDFNIFLQKLPKVCGLCSSWRSGAIFSPPFVPGGKSFLPLSGAFRDPLYVCVDRAGRLSSDGAHAVLLNFIIGGIIGGFFLVRRLLAA